MKRFKISSWSRLWTESLIIIGGLKGHQWMQSTVHILRKKISSKIRWIQNIWKDLKVQGPILFWEVTRDGYQRWNFPCYPMESALSKIILLDTILWKIINWDINSIIKSRISIVSSKIKKTEGFQNALMMNLDSIWLYITLILKLKLLICILKRKNGGIFKKELWKIFKFEVCFRFNLKLWRVIYILYYYKKIK